MNLGIKLREYRINKNMTITALADKIGTSRSYISDIERGVKKPSIDMLEKIAEALEINAEELVSSDESELSPELKKLLNNAKDLPPSVLETINKMIESLNDNFKVVHKEIAGIDTTYVIDLNKKPNGLTKEEELEAQQLIRRLNELNKLENREP